MSEENIEIVRRLYEAFNNGGIDAAEPYYASDIEMFDAPEFPDASRRTGATQVREMLSNYMETGWDGRFDVQEYIDVEPEVIVVWRMHARAPASGITLAPTTFFHVCQLEDGKLKRLWQFLSREQALEAVGLSK
jgi:ketosteroid isomerase-like protein